MKKVLLSVLLAACNLLALDLNSNGWNDTCAIPTFKADSTKRSKAFPLSTYENCRFDVLAMDTGNSTTTFASAAIKFYWWLETGHLSLNRLTGKTDTVWSRIDPLIVDTFDITTAGNMAATPRYLQTDGTFLAPTKTIDTLSVRGFAVQSRAVSPEWDEYVRFGFKGLTGNLTAGTAFIKLWCAVHRRAYQNMRDK